MVKSSVSKIISTEISDINHFLNNKTFIIHSNDNIINGCSFKTQGNEKGINYSIELNDWITSNEIDFNYLGFNTDFQIESNLNVYVIPRNSINKIKSKIGFVKELTGSLLEIYTKDFPLINESYFRLFIKTKQQYIPNIFLGSEYQCNDVHYALGLTKIETNEGIFHIYRHKVKDSQEAYLVIESLNETSFKYFQTLCDSILKSLGFLTGNWLKDEHFYFTYSSNCFENKSSIYYVYKGSSILNNYEIINPREFKTFINSDKKDYRLENILFPEKILSTIIMSIIQKTEYERTIELLIEGNTAITPLVRASVFSVALETITSLINKDNKSYFQTLKQTNEIKSIIDDIREFVDSKKHTLQEEEYSFLLKKINSITNPPNKNKYLRSFELFKIDLPTELKKLLDTRNKFFHGKTPYPEDSYKNKVKDFNLEADRLHMLVSILLLKYAGYKGHIKNQAGFRINSSDYFLETKITSNESPFYTI